MSGLFFASFFCGISGVVMLFCVVCSMLILRKMDRFSKGDVIAMAVIFTAAFSVNQLYTVLYADMVRGYSGYIGGFTGRITDYDVYEGDFAVYVLDGRIDSGQKAKITMTSNELGAEYGDILEIESCEFRRIESSYLFDSEMYNNSRHIFLEAVKADGIRVSQGKSGKLRRYIADFRAKMISRMRAAVGGEAGGFLAGMMFGEKQYIDSGTKAELYRTGIGHILAVSGLHVSIVSSFVMMILKHLNVNRFIRFGMVNSVILFVVALADFPVSAIRAALMIDMIYSAELFRQQNDSLNSLAVTALIICLADPYAVYSSGFILSLSGTAGAAVFAPYMTENISTGKIGITFLNALYTSIAVTPASMYYFSEVSIISPITNIVLVPVCMAAMFFGILFVVTGGIFDALLYPSEFLIDIVLKISDKTAVLGFAHISKTSGAVPLIFIVMSLATLFIYLFSGSRRATSAFIAVSAVVCTAGFAVIRHARSEKLIAAVFCGNENYAAVISYRGKICAADISGNHKSASYVRKYAAENGLEINSLILTESVQAQYAAYTSELKLFPLENIYAVCGVRTENEYFETISGNGTEINAGDYIIEIENGCITVVSETDTIVIPVDSQPYIIGSDGGAVDVELILYK